MKTEPSSQHIWLQQLIGEWTSEFEWAEAGKPPIITKGTENIRSLGGFWIIAESKHEKDADHDSVMTIGYDPQKQRFTGSFVGAMSTYLWLYEGTLDESGKVLTLESEGPSMKDDGTTAKYRDAITIIAADHRTFTSSILGEDGEWSEFMTIHYWRVK